MAGLSLGEYTALCLPLSTVSFVLCSFLFRSSRGAAGVLEFEDGPWPWLAWHSERDWRDARSAAGEAASGGHAKGDGDGSVSALTFHGMVPTVDR